MRKIKTFTKTIPDFDGNEAKLKIFISWSSTAKTMFLEYLIFKLWDRAQIVYEAKALTDLTTLRKHFIVAIADKKSIASLQNELLSLKQKQGQSVNDFTEIVRLKLKKIIG